MLLHALEVCKQRIPQIVIASVLSFDSLKLFQGIIVATDHGQTQQHASNSQQSRDHVYLINFTVEISLILYVKV